jgi:hypothetical protein
MQISATDSDKGWLDLDLSVRADGLRHVVLEAKIAGVVVSQRAHVESCFLGLL